MAILDDLKHLYDTRAGEIDSWLDHQRQQTPPFVTTSVDLRHSGVRLVPVDVNLFPAGFNNLSPAAVQRAIQNFKKYLSKYYPNTKKIAVIAESHTRNIPYLINLQMLQEILMQAGYTAQLGSLIAGWGEPLELDTDGDDRITLYAMESSGGRLQLDGGFVPELVLMNHDMTAGVPPVLQNIAQPVIPPPELGWHRRRKSVHFSAYGKMAESFGSAFSIDPWLISAGFHACGMVDFKQREGLECLAESVEELLACARKKYKHYGIDQEPYVYIKADSGTYGMGVMTVNSARDVLEMNKKERNKMHVIKEGTQVHEVIIQEGIPTIDRVDGKPAEPMIYLVGGCPTGGMFRVNGARDPLNNLNAKGMEFTGMCDQNELMPDMEQVKNCHFRSFGLIASLSALAAAREDYDNKLEIPGCKEA